MLFLSHRRSGCSASVLLADRKAKPDTILILRSAIIHLGLVCVGDTRGTRKKKHARRAHSFSSATSPFEALLHLPPAAQGFKTADFAYLSRSEHLTGSPNLRSSNFQNGTKKERYQAFFFSEPSEIRTPDTLIKSQVLCRLS